MAWLGLFSSSAAKGSRQPAPSPAKPYAPRAVGTQDSPVLPGQKPGQIPAPVQAMAGKKRRATGWWEDDWANIARTTATTKIKHEQINTDLPGKDIASRQTPIEGEGYSDVVPVDFRQRTIQGNQHRVVVPERAAGDGNPAQAQIDQGYAGWAGVGVPRLDGTVRVVAVDSYKSVVNGPASVSPGFLDLGPPELVTDNRIIYR